MNAIIRYFIRYPIWANTLMCALLVFGFIMLMDLKTSFFPETKANRINISVLYPGASPEEIEQRLILEIEKNLEGISGVDRITSVSYEGRGNINIEVLDSYDTDDVYSDVKGAIDRVNSWPDGAQKADITIPHFRSRVINIAIYGDADLYALKVRAKVLKDALLGMDGISQVSISGIPDREIVINVSREAMRRYNINFTEISNAVKSHNIDLSAGSLDSKHEQFLIRAYGRQDNSVDIGNIILRSTAKQILRISDIGDVEETWAKGSRRTYFNGKRALIVKIDKTLEEDILAISDMVNEYMPTFAHQYPEVETFITTDKTVHLRQRINLLSRNGLFGFALVILILSLFLNVRIAFWVALGLPISFAGMFIVANIYGITINVLSLFGMIIVVGILVDDAIVVAESIWQRTEKGESPFVAAVEGVKDVSAPVFTSVLTTIFAFLPFFFFSGMLGSIVDQLAIVVVGALFFSLVESLLILPPHLAHSKGILPDQKMGWIRHKSEIFYKYLINKIYGPLLKRSMKLPFVIIAIAIAFIMVTFGLLKGKYVEASDFPNIDRDDFRVNVTLTAGTQIDVTDSIMTIIETRLWNMNENMKEERDDEKDVVVSIERSVNKHTGILDVELLPAHERNMDSYIVKGMARKSIGTILGVEKLSFGGGHWGKPINISLRSSNLKDLRKATIFLKNKLAEYPDIKDVVDGDELGQREVCLECKPAAYQLGLSLIDIARQIRNGFFGIEIQRFQRGDDEIHLWVRYQDEDRNSLGDLEAIMLRTPSGSEVKLSSIVDYTIVRGPVAIRHIDGQRQVSVEADLADKNIAVNGVVSMIKKEVIPQVTDRFSSVRIGFEGRQRQNVKFYGSLKTSFSIAIIGILIILTLVFRSLWQAMMIFLMIPLGAAGAIWGHLFHGHMLSRLSIFGLIALSGIVINDSIVFIDQINKNLRNGMNLFDAVYYAGLTRLRPIILTTITTVVGMLPLIMETSRQAQFLIPMALSVSYGLIFGSFFILFAVPSLFLALNRIRVWWKMLDGVGLKFTRESVEPAVMERTHNFPIASERGLTDAE